MTNKKEKKLFSKYHVRDNTDHKTEMQIISVNKITAV